MDRIKLLSPAKTNLYLKIINKRPDGFHELKTVFQRINLCDEITFAANDSGKIKIKCNHPHVPVGKKNLVYKVAELLQSKYHVTKGVDVVIKKKIPVAAGLAGGSSNAATALVGLNKIWNLGLSRAQLARFAGKLGSDITFFLYDTSWAIGTGRGEKIRKLEIERKLWQIVVVPKIKMYSSVVYGGLKMSLTKKDDNANILIHNLKNASMLGLGEYLTNDLETVITRLEPRLLKLKERLKSLNLQGVMISGSGPSVFGLVNSEWEAKRLKNILKRRYSQVFAVRTL